MRRQLAATIGVVCVAALAGCVDDEKFGPEAARCADLVKFYLELPSPVELLQAEPSADKPQVRVDYRSMNRENIPVTGLALCRFSTDGQLVLTDAFVDENRLSEQEITAFNESRPAGES